MKKEQKKSIKVSNKNNVNNKKPVEKDRILRELAIKLKALEEEEKSTPKKKDREESELEREADVNLNLRDFEFQDFARFSDESSSPVLERIAGAQTRPIFVGGIPQGSNTNSDEKESDPFKYVPGNNANGEPKYIDSDSHIRAIAERVDFNRIGREGPTEINQEAMFVQSQEARFESQFQEKFESAERFDAGKNRKKHPFENEQAKYDKYKPDLPKSR